MRLVVPSLPISLRHGNFDLAVSRPVQDFSYRFHWIADLKYVLFVSRTGHLSRLNGVPRVAFQGRWHFVGFRGGEILTCVL